VPVAGKDGERPPHGGEMNEGGGRAMAGRRFKSLMLMVGVDVERLCAVWGELIYFFRSKRAFERQQTGADAFARGKLYPCLFDRAEGLEFTSRQYFKQDLLVAQMIHRANPQRHIDVGSRIDGFVAHVAVFRQIEVFDIRRVALEASNIVFVRKDLMDRDPSLVECTDSLSCLHALEHFGLGRYGDRIDCDGHLSGLKNLARMVRPGGRLYLSVPIGREQRIEFNAHRVFSLPYLLAAFFACGLEVASFHYLDDQDDLHSVEDWDGPAARDTFGLTFGCGIFELTKAAA
jgi:hypothetical protein